LAATGAVAGSVLAEILLRVFIAIAPRVSRFSPRRGSTFASCYSQCWFRCFGAALFGILPALEKPRVTALVGRQTKSGAHARLRRFLVAAQIAISMVLLSGASLLVKSFWNLEQQNLGMQTRDVFTLHVPLNWERYPSGQSYMSFFLRVEAALRRLPGVTAVGMTNSLPPDANSWHDGRRLADIFISGKPSTAPGTGGTVVARIVTPDYFRVLQIPIVRGRDSLRKNGIRAATSSFSASCLRRGSFLRETQSDSTYSSQTTIRISR